ncbi:MAG: hypothetical protein MMC23_009277 [Stictis urceolatum]|nr:hypothetical protein [Stictis urceolata]
MTNTRPKLTKIISSDLQRAFRTAEALLSAQKHKFGSVAVETVIQTALLREQDLGSLEKQAYRATLKSIGKALPKDDNITNVQNHCFGDAESKVALDARADAFLDEYIIPSIQSSSSRNESVVAVVSHGLLLSRLWKALFKRFLRSDVRLSPDILAEGGVTNLEHLGPWSNSGFLEVHIHKIPIYLRTAGFTDTSAGHDLSAMEIETPMLTDWTLTVQAINSREHLKGFKRTGGGVGSSKLDDSQSTIDSYFKKRRIG